MQWLIIVHWLSDPSLTFISVAGWPVWAPGSGPIKLSAAAPVGLEEKRHAMFTECQLSDPPFFFK